jgi:hypothetical protein
MGAAIGVSHNVQRLSKLIFFMIMFSHWDGCLLFLVAYLEGFPTNSWVRRTVSPTQPPLIEMSSFEQYSWSVYSAVSQIFAISFGVANPETVRRATAAVPVNH